MIKRTDYVMFIPACAGVVIACVFSPLLGVLFWSAGTCLIDNKACILSQAANFDEWLNAGDAEKVVFLKDVRSAKTYILTDGALSKKWFEFFIFKDQILEKDFQELEGYIKDNFSIANTDSLSLGFSSRVGTAETSTNKQYPFISADQFIYNFSDIKKNGCVPGVLNKELADTYKTQIAAHNNENYKTPGEVVTSKMFNSAEQNNDHENKTLSGQLDCCNSFSFNKFFQNDCVAGATLE